MSEAQTNERPKNLNIISILSFVGIGLFIALGVFMIIGGIAAKQMFNDPEMLNAAQEMIMTNEALDASAKEKAISDLNNTRHMGSAGGGMIIAQLFCLFGVLKMRKLEKTGFAIYSIGEIGLPLGLAVLLGFSWQSLAGFLVAGVFVALYAMHLKFMRN